MYVHPHRTHVGSCHCGAIRFDPAGIPVRQSVGAAMP
jgi:hypothetical protein